MFPGTLGWGDLREPGLQVPDQALLHLVDDHGRRRVLPADQHRSVLGALLGDEARHRLSEGDALKGVLRGDLQAFNGHRGSLWLRSA